MKLAPGGWLGLTVLLAGCLMREGDPRRAGSSPCLWEFPGEDYEVRVFGPIPIEEMRDFVRERESEGWQVCGCEPVSLPEDVMVDGTELDRPSPPRRRMWTFDIPKPMDDGLDPPAPKLRESDGSPVDSIPPYLEEAVRRHRQQVLIVLGRWR